MMIRVAGLVGQVQRGFDTPSIDGRSPMQQLAAIREKLADLSQQQQAIWRELRARLTAQARRGEPANFRDRGPGAT